MLFPFQIYTYLLTKLQSGRGVCICILPNSSPPLPLALIPWLYQVDVWNGRKRWVLQRHRGVRGTSLLDTPSQAYVAKSVVKNNYPVHLANILKNNRCATCLVIISAHAGIYRLTDTSHPDLPVVTQCTMIDAFDLPIITHWSVVPQWSTAAYWSIIDSHTLIDSYTLIDSHTRNMN